jgi:hypothetical protein
VQERIREAMVSLQRLEREKGEHEQRLRDLALQEERIRAALNPGAARCGVY